MGLFSKKLPSLKINEKRTVFLVKHDRWLELHEAKRSISGWYVQFTETNCVLLLEAGKVIGTRSVIGWFPHEGWTPEAEDQFRALKNSLANE